MSSKFEKYYNANNISLEDIGHQVLRGLIFEDRVVVYVVPTLQRNVIDTWTHSVTDTVEHWRDSDTRHQYPFLAFYDFTQLGILAGMTPYFRQTALEMAKKHPDNFGNYAILLSQGSMVINILNTLNRTLKPIQPHMIGQIFNHPAPVLEWLEEKVTQE